MSEGRRDGPKDKRQEQAATISFDHKHSGEHIRQRRADISACEFDDSVPDLLQRIYAGRGLTHQSELKLDLAELPPPDQLSGLDKALDLLLEALTQNLSIIIVGDFDADGATSTALSMLALKSMGYHRIGFLVPDRFKFGYGLTSEIVALAAEQNPDVLITVDNGISSNAGVDAAVARGIRVLITDHHLPGDELPKAEAIVNPHQSGCLFPGKNLAGVGVIFYVMSALRGRLRRSGWFAEKGIEEPNMARWLDLVALGTVADVVPLDKINRVLIHQGLARIQAGQARPGILALLELANRDHRRIVSSDLGFAVGPRLNAAGRLEDMTIGINCLLADDALQARQFALQLDELNRDRRIIEADMEREALAIVSDLHLDEDSMPWGLCLMDTRWHQGVVGLLASRVKDRFHRPVIAFAEGVSDKADAFGADTGELSRHGLSGGELKGSARSIPGLHIRDVLDSIAAKNPGMINKFGGHAMAAGLSLAANNFSDFAVAFDAEVRQVLSLEDMHAETLIDGELAGSEMNLTSAELLRQGGPWGQHFPEPSFVGEFTIVEQRVVAEKHLKMILSPLGNKDQMIDAIAFGLVDKYDVESLPRQLDLVYRLDVNEFRGRQSAQLLVEKLLVPEQ